MIKKQILIIVLTIAMLFSFLGSIHAAEHQFDLQTESALLVDATTGELLFEKNIHEPLYPASITKIMTLLLAFEAIEEGKVSLEDEVIVSEEAASMGGSQIFLEQGDKVSLEDLLIGIAVGSGNDASVAVAEHIAGSLEGFVEIMNERAFELGMDNTNFENACGLHVDEHVTTAKDIVIMSRELLKYPQVNEWFSIWMDEEFLKGKISVEEGIYLSNTNRLVRYYSGCDGLKTGFTDQAGHCIAATAKREDSRFISVILNAPDSKTRFDEATQLLDYAFANYKTIPIAEKDEVVGEVAVQKGKETTLKLVLAKQLGVLVKKADDPEFQKDINITHSLNAPITEGEKIGEFIVTWEGEEVAQGDLSAEKDVQRATVFDIFYRTLEAWVRFGK